MKLGLKVTEPLDSRSSLPIPNMKNNKKLNTECYNSQNNPENNNDVSISMLNDDCMKYVLSFLSFKKRLVLQRVCKKWQALMPWGGVKKLELGETQIVCDSELISEYSMPALKKVLSLCGSSLTHVEIEYIHDKATRIIIFKLIKKLCPNVSSLDLGNFELHKQAADFIISNFNCLREITIGDCTVIDEDKISKIFSGNKGLRSVKFTYSVKLRGNCLSSLFLNLIKEFEILDSEEFLFTNVEKALQQMSNLRILSFSGNLLLTENMDGLLKAIPNRSNLDYLSIDASVFLNEIGFVHINSLGDLINLRVLNLSGTSILHNETLAIIGNYCKNLEVVFLSASDAVTDAGWKEFAKIQRLKKLKISEFRNFSDKCLFDLQVSSLESLICHKIDGLTNESLHFVLKSAKKLKMLDVALCKFVKMNTLVKAASVEAENRPKNERIELHVKIDRSVCSVLRNISSQLIVQESDCFMEFCNVMA